MVRKVGKERMYKNFVFLLGVTTNNNNSAEKACFFRKILLKSSEQLKMSDL